MHTRMFRVWNCVFIQIRVSAGIASRILKEVAVHAKSTFHACKWSYAHARNGRSCRSSGQWGTAALSASAASAYPYAASIDQEFARLTKDLELTPKQQQQVRPLLEEHHDKIQALLDKNPKSFAAGAWSADSRYQRRNAPPDSCPAYRSPERIGKGDAATRA